MLKKLSRGKAINDSKRLAAEQNVRTFFANCDTLDGLVLRPLSHIRGNWELTWDPQANHYEPEDDSFAEPLNQLIHELAHTLPPENYHLHEDAIAENLAKTLKWRIRKVGSRWVGEDCKGPDDYACVLEQGAFPYFEQDDLVLAATGRVWAAIRRGQLSFDDMEWSHRVMLAAILSNILYWRADHYPSC